MNPLIGAGLISGVGSLFGSLASSGISQKQSKELMDYQYQLQQQAIEKANLYNSPTEQMKRLASAGLNPNLTGNISPGESADLPDDGNPPMASSDDLGELSNFASGLMSCVSTAYGLVNSALSTISGIQDIKAKGLANKKSALDLGSQLSNFAEEAVFRNLPAGINIKDYGEVTNWYNKLKSQYGKFMSKKDFMNFVNLANDFQHNVNVQGKYFKGNKEYHENRKASFRIGANTDEYSEDDAVMWVFSEALSNLATKVFKSESRNRITKADYESTYLESMNPEQMANAETVRKVNEATISGHEVGIKADEEQLLDTKVLMRDTVKQIISGLDNLSNEGSFLAQVAKGIVSIVAIRYLGY